MRTLGRTIDSNISKPVKKRTRKKKANTRPHVISVRLNDAELAQLEKLAAESDCSMAEILRRGLERMMG